jgi:hypothetical protein
MRQSTAGSLGFSFDRPLHIRPDPQSIADAYVYLLGRMLVIRQEHIDLDQVGADYNVLTYDPLGNADLVNPNFDVASLEGWLAVDDGTPAVLEVPEIINRYYTVQVMDEWGDVIANINPRTFPSHPHGTFVFVKPDTRVQVPPDAARIVLRSNKAKVLARSRSGRIAMASSGFSGSLPCRRTTIPRSSLPRHCRRSAVVS